MIRAGVVLTALGVAGSAAGCASLPALHDASPRCSNAPTEPIAARDVVRVMGARGWMLLPAKRDATCGVVAAVLSDLSSSRGGLICSLRTHPDEELAIQPGRIDAGRVEYTLANLECNLHFEDAPRGERTRVLLSALHELRADALADR